MFHVRSVLVVLSIWSFATIVKAQLDESHTEITSPPSLLVEMGNTLTLVCIDFEGAEVEWYKANQEIDSTQDSGFLITSSKELKQKNLVTRSKLVKNVVDESDSDTFECRSLGTDTSHKTMVTVFSIHSNKPTLSKVEPVVLQCNVVGLTSYQPIMWYRNGTLLTTEKYKANYQNNTLTIHDIDENDAGDYACAFQSEGQNFSHVVSVSDKPHVKHFDKSKNLVQGDPLVLECKAWGHPTPLLRWTKNDIPLDTNDSRITLSDHKNIANGTLRIARMDFADRANYGCHAFNEFGNSSSATLVRVKDKLAALWPFLGICAEVAILCIIIFVYEKRRAKKMQAEEAPEEAGQLTNSNDHRGNDDIRQRK